MTAPTLSTSNFYAGMREFGQVTNTYAGYLQSGGVAYTIATPFQADKFEWWRYTGFGTAQKLASGVWFRDFPAGACLINQTIADNGATGTNNNILETTNGITIANTGGGFASEQKVITNITAATPGVVTSTAHGFTNGQRVIITQVVGSLGASVNNQTFVVNNVTANTFQLYDIYGFPVTTSGTYTSGGQATLTGPSLGIVNSPISYKLTLGSSVMGSDNDVIYFVAYHFNNYVNVGDVA